MKIVCSRVGTIVLVLGLFLIGFFSCDMSTNYALADDGGTVPHASSLSDYLTDYFRWRYNFLPTPSNSAPLFFSGATIAEGDSSTEYVVTVTSDDPITNIVPRSLFESANTTLSMADGFAYCVHTWLDVGDGVFRTTVTFFSISTQWLLSTLDLRVDVIAKIDYVQVSNNSVVHLHGVLEDDETNLWNITAHLSGLESAVIPLFRLDHTQEPVVVDSMNMDVCNIWLATTIRSVNQLNNFDDGYNASVDSGYFLTSTRYQYAGQRHDEAGETQQIINRVQDICCGIIGMIPIVGNAFTLIYSGFCVADSFVSVPNIVYTRDDDIDMITTTYPICATRSEQIQNYGYLLKTALMEIAPDDPLLFCTGDYVEGFYTYAHFDVGYVLGVTSQVLMNLGLMVKNSRTGATDFTVINDVVIAEKDAPTSGEQLEMCENNSFYMLPNTTHWFSFTPVYSGKYALSVNGTIGAVEINGLPVTPTGGEYRFEGIANTPIDILLYPVTDTITKGSISIDVATNTGTQAYAPLEARISKLSVASDGLYKIQSSETSVLLDQILVLENGSFDEYVLPFDQVGSDITWSSASVWNIPLPAGEYYVLCRNSGDSDKNASVSKSSITQTNRNITKVLTLSATNYTFIKFVPSDSQNNAVAVSNNAQGLECILVYADASAYYDHRSSHGFSFGGSQGTPIYIGFRALNNVSVSVKIKLDANAYKWIIDGTAISGQQVSLNVNRSYSVCLRVNDVYTAETLDLQNSYSGIALINPSTLVLTDDTSLGTPFLLQAVAGVGINYAYSLCVTPVFSHSFAVFAVNNASQVGLTWTSQDYGYTSTVWAACNDNNALLDSFTISTSASSNTGTVDLVALASQACASCRFITLRLTRVMTSHHIQDVPAETAPSVRVDTWFGGGMGTQASPNLIKNIRHFNNIKIVYRVL